MAYTASAAAATEVDEAGHEMSEAFQKYYALQALCPPSEWEETLRLLRRPMLLSVRVNRVVAGEAGVGAAVAQLQSLLADSLKPIPWLPSAFIVQADGVFAAPSGGESGDAPSDSAGAALPPLDASAHTEGGGRERTLDEAVQLALFRGMKSGELAQQEATSMVPPLLLAPEPQHTVLDMCAAPGSKTTQLLDMMGANPPGMLIANERDPARMRRLSARMQRQPCSPVLVTGGEAQVRRDARHVSARRPCPRCRRIRCRRRARTRPMLTALRRSDLDRISMGRQTGARSACI